MREISHIAIISIVIAMSGCVDSLDERGGLPPPTSPPIDAPSPPPLIDAPSPPPLIDAPLPPPPVVATSTFLTVVQIVPGQPGHVTISGHVLGANGEPVNGTVNVNFSKVENSVWTFKNFAQPQVVNSYYEVLSWPVGVGHWRVRAVFPAQGIYLGSESNYHEFDVTAR